ncbi:MAG: PilZ domain-containing protein [Deltaproteobacteria bacterium]
MDSGKKGGGPANATVNATPREHVRADDVIPVYYELLDGSRELKHSKGWETLFDEIEPGPEENPKLYEILFDINNKLNSLLEYISVHDGFRIPQAKNVNISGGGLQFYCYDEFKAGDLIAIKTFLPTYAHTVTVRCEVMRVVPRTEGGYEIAVRYVDMDEATRDKIIRYVFARQRKLLRTEKGGGTDTEK